jgi:hypothetical protein
LEFGFTLLEKIQSYTGVRYSQEDLQLPYQLYLLRQKHKKNTKVQIILKRAYQLIFTLELERAKTIIEAVEQVYGV